MIKDDEFSFAIWAKKSKELLEQLKALPKESELEIENTILKYIKCRYILDRIPKKQELLYDLAEESIANMSKISVSGLNDMEVASGCKGAKSAAVKKVLLIMSLKNIVEKDIGEEEYLSISTVEELIWFVLNKIK